MITLTREEAQQVLDAMTRIRWAAGERDKKNRVRDFDDAMDVSGEAIETLRARLAQPEPDAAYDYASRLAEAIYQKHYRQDSPEWKPLDDTLGVLTQIDNMTCRLVKAQPEPEPVAWQPIDTAPKGKIVLVHYKNRLGNGRTMRARYYLPETLESDESESGWADEGWYEESEAYEYLMPLEGEPTHWMPLPPAPDAAPPQHKEPEPVAWEYCGALFYNKEEVFAWHERGDISDTPPRPLYTAPPQREWQGLTDEEYEAMAEQYVTNCYFDTLKYARAIEAKLKEKNNG